MIIEKNPDFVIFTGDLFEHYNPSPPEIIQSIGILEQLKEKEIPIYVISGNHDVSYALSKRYGGNILHLLEEIGLIHYLDDDVALVQKNNKPKALIAGLRYYGKKTPDKLKEFYENNKEKFVRSDIPKILMLHSFIEGTVVNFDITPYALNLYPFDYIAMGHYHIKWPSDFHIDNNKIFFSGATEHRSSTEWGHDRGFITVEATNTGKNWAVKPEFTSFPVRPKKIIFKDFGITTADTIVNTTKSLIEKNDEDGILLRIILKGSIKTGEFSFINTQTLKSFSKKSLYVDIINSITSSSITSKTEVSEREAITEVLKNNFNIKQEIINDYIALIENIMKISNDKNFEKISSEILNEFITKNLENIEKSQSFVELNILGPIDPEKEPKARQGSKTEPKVKKAPADKKEPSGSTTKKTKKSKSPRLTSF